MVHEFPRGGCESLFMYAVVMTTSQSFETCWVGVSSSSPGGHRQCLRRKERPSGGIALRALLINCMRPWHPLSAARPLAWIWAGACATDRLHTGSHARRSLQLSIRGAESLLSHRRASYHQTTIQQYAASVITDVRPVLFSPLLGLYHDAVRWVFTAGRARVGHVHESFPVPHVSSIGSKVAIFGLRCHSHVQKI